jgi:hypothetical protein
VSRWVNIPAAHAPEFRSLQTAYAGRAFPQFAEHLCETTAILPVDRQDLHASFPIIDEANDAPAIDNLTCHEHLYNVAGVILRHRYRLLMPGASQRGTAERRQAFFARDGSYPSMIV